MRPDESAAIIARGAALSIALEPFESDEDVAAVDSAIAAMLGGFRSMRHRGDDVEAMVTVARAVMMRRKFPRWAVEEACLRVASKQTRHVEWAPNDVEIVAVVEQVVKPYAEAFAAVKRLIEAVPPSENAARRATIPRQTPPALEPMTDERRKALNEDLAERKRRNDERKPDAAE